MWGGILLPSQNGKQKFERQSDGSTFFTQQLIRLGFNYDISPDVVFFVPTSGLPQLGDRLIQVR